MKNDELIRAQVHASIDKGLAHIEERPSLRYEIMQKAKGEPKVKRKISVALVCAVVMMVVLCSAALATGLKLFDHFSEIKMDDQPWDAERLLKLNDNAVTIGKTFHLTLPVFDAKGDTDRDKLAASLGGREFDLTVDDVYCDGRKLYYTYTLAYGENQVFTGEGKPTGIDKWDMEWTGEEWENIASFGHSEFWDEEDAWFKAQTGPSWFASQSIALGDGLDLADGTELRIWDSWLEQDVDEHIWKSYYEVALPEGYEAGESVDIVMTVMYGMTLNYVDDTGVYWARIAPEENRGFLRVPLTVPVTGSAAQLAGESKQSEYSAEAEIFVSDVDVSGVAIVHGPADWKKAYDYDSEEEGGNYIRDFLLVADGETMEDFWGPHLGIGGDGEYKIELRYNLPESTESLALRPVYRDGTIPEDEDIVLK